MGQSVRWITRPRRFPKWWNPRLVGDPIRLELEPPGYVPDGWSQRILAIDGDAFHVTTWISPTEMDVRRVVSGWPGVPHPLQQPGQDVQESQEKT